MTKRIIELLKREIAGVDFIPAYSSKAASRRPRTSTVTVGVKSENLAKAHSETKLELCIYPKEGEVQTAEDIFVEVCDVLYASFPAITSISRVEVKIEAKTGELYVPCSVSLAGDLREEQYAKIDGVEHAISGSRTSLTSTSKSLTSFGETQPYAVVDETVVYTVTLEGIDTKAMPLKAGFTVELSDGMAYRGCAWKKLGENEAVFTSSEGEYIDGSD